MSGITQQIQIRVQDVSIDELSIHWEIRLFPGNSKLNKKSHTLYFSKYRNYQQLNGRKMPPVFEVSNFKLILKHVFANNFL